MTILNSYKCSKATTVRFGKISFASETKDETKPKTQTKEKKANDK